MQNDLSIVFIPQKVCFAHFITLNCPDDITDAQIVNDENIRDGQTDVAKWIEGDAGTSPLQQWIQIVEAGLWIV